jgi:hypothetical protein
MGSGMLYFSGPLSSRGVFVQLYCGGDKDDKPRVNVQTSDWVQSLRAQAHHFLVYLMDVAKVICTVGYHLGKLPHAVHDTPP